MGLVYLAEDLKLNRPVALKLLPPQSVSDPQRRQRFLREARTEAALSHPGIAAVYEVDEAEGNIFIAMEFVEGKTLRETVGGRPLPLGDALRIACEMAEALSFAHEARVVHRDLKPDNVIVRTDGHIKILDFGLAKFLKEPPQVSLSEVSQAATASADLTLEMTVMGTAAYMAPEQARGEKADLRADLFALGVILYEMLTGRNPFRRGGYHETLNAVVHAEAPPLLEANPDVPAELAEVVARCLEKNRDRRYGSAEALKEDLDGFQARLFASQACATAAAGREPWRSPVLAIVGTAVAVAVLAGVLAWPPLQERFFGAADAGRIESIAVLPFDNLSNDPNQEFLADGMTDVLIIDLSRIRTLKVISRTSVMRYKGAKKPLSRIARELDVQAVLEGSVLLAGDRVRITAQLIDARRDSHIWAKDYEGATEDLFRLQGDVSEAVAREIAASLTGEDSPRLAARPTTDPVAYEHYLRGKFHLGKYYQGASDALAEFQKAVEIDPQYAPAWVGLAESYWLLSTVVIPPEEAMPKVQAAARRALEIDEGLGEAHAILAMVASHYAMDMTRADADFRRALELNPGYALGHEWYGSFLTYLGRPEEARAELELARSLDPLSTMTSLMAAWPDFYAPPGQRRFEDAIHKVRAILMLEPDMLPARLLLTFLYEATARLDEALGECRRAVELSESHPAVLAALARVHALRGEVSDARRLLRSILEGSHEEPIIYSFLAATYAALEQPDLAFEALERSLAQREEDLLWVAVDPRFDSLRGDPRYGDLVRRMNLNVTPEEPAIRQIPHISLDRSRPDQIL